MEQYIPKSALVAEITKIYDRNRSNGYIDVCDEIDDILSFLDTLEMKEVDLEKEIKEVQRNYKTIDEYEGYPAHIYSSDIELIARHFFSLGVNASNPLTWEDVRDIMELYDKVTSMDYCNDIYEEVLKRFKALKEE